MEGWFPPSFLSLQLVTAIHGGHSADASLIRGYRGTTPDRGRDTYAFQSDGGTRYARLPPVIEIIPLSGYLLPHTHAFRIIHNANPCGVNSVAATATRGGIRVRGGIPSFWCRGIRRRRRDAHGLCRRQIRRLWLPIRRGSHGRG